MSSAVDGSYPTGFFAESRTGPIQGIPADPSLFPLAAPVAGNQSGAAGLSCTPPINEDIR
jgi:hypothetical protein